MLSPIVVYAVHDEIIFDLFALITNSCAFLAGDACRRGTAFGRKHVMPKFLLAEKVALVLAV
jgi:hypothetical protein